MNIIDIAIILFLLLGVAIGFNRGFFKQTVITVGTVLTLYLAFIFKHPIAVFLYENFPALKFDGLSSLNILLYDAIAFILLYLLLWIILKILISLAGGLEKLLKMTVILAIPSKIMGAVVGLVQQFIILFVILLIISSPVFNIPMVNESKYKDVILNDTPILSNMSSDLVKTFDEIFSLKNDTNNAELNNKIYDIIVKNGLITKEKVQEFINKNK